MRVEYRYAYAPWVFVVYCVRMARTAATELQDFLIELAKSATPGERIPAIRELMKRFRVSQVVVERAFQDLKSRGLIASQIGRGTFFRGGDVSALSAKSSESKGFSASSRSGDQASRSVLLLRRSISLARGRLVIDGLQRRFAADGYRVLEVAYTDPDHARLVLKGLPHLDACVVQSTYKPIPVELLADLRSKCDVLAVDGAALCGADVESVGMEWGEPLEQAIELLCQNGHRRIVYASTDSPFLAGQMGQRRFEYLQRRLQGVELTKVTVPAPPHDQYQEALVKLLVEKMQSAPYTGLAVWGVEDGRRFFELMAEAGIKIPTDLSVVLLGRTDISSEHGHFFHTIGCQLSDQVDSLCEAIKARWADPNLPYSIRLIPVASLEGESVVDIGRSKAQGDDANKRSKRSAAATAA